jgi:thiol-disulfide isomerase/thioredoxin
MRTKILAFSLLLTIAFVFGVDSGFGQEKAKDFELVDINGKSFSLSEYLGKVVLLDFFATWCGPCIMEIEHLQALQKDYSSEQLVILSISVDIESDSLLKLQLFAQQNQMQWTVAQDTDNVGYKYGVSPIPHLVVVDTEGYKRYSHIGVTAASTLRSEIDALISENGNGGSGGSDAAQTEGDYTLLAVVAVCGIALFVVGIIAVKKRRDKSKRIRTRSARTRKRMVKVLRFAHSEKIGDVLFISCTNFPFLSFRGFTLMFL